MIQHNFHCCKLISVSNQQNRYKNHFHNEPMLFHDVSSFYLQDYHFVNIIPVADPGFTVGGGAPTPEAATFCKICMSKQKNLDP